jgi:ElaB/YqjD/DUF883 family membrane-anchored ribosome-binding protein
MDDTTRGLGRESMSGRGEDSRRDYASPPAVPPDSDKDTNRRTQEIRAEIEHTREEMSETIEAIQERLQPGNIVAGATERVRAAATEKVRDMADSASETARNAIDRTREMTGDFAEIGRQNAIPAAMIGAGVAWLIIDRFREGQSQRSWDRSNRDRGSYRYGGAENDSADRYRQGGWSDTSDRLASGARDAGRAARRTGHQAQNQLQRLMRENPLMAGAAAAVIGAAVGMALPETDRENEWLGDAKETVMDRAQDVARNAATAVQEAAGDMAGEVAKTVIGGKSTER